MQIQQVDRNCMLCSNRLDRVYRDSQGFQKCCLASFTQTRMQHKIQQEGSPSLQGGTASILNLAFGRLHHAATRRSGAPHSTHSELSSRHRCSTLHHLHVGAGSGASILNPVCRSRCPSFAPDSGLVSAVALHRD